jgi:hypothetical protein
MKPQKENDKKLDPLKGRKCEENVACYVSGGWRECPILMQRKVARIQEKQER